MQLDTSGIVGLREIVCVYGQTQHIEALQDNITRVIGGNQAEYFLEMKLK